MAQWLSATELIPGGPARGGSAAGRGAHWQAICRLRLWPVATLAGSLQPAGRTRRRVRRAGTVTGEEITKLNLAQAWKQQTGHTHTSFIEQTQYRQPICFVEMASSTPFWAQARTLACGLCRCYYYPSLLLRHFTRPRLLRYPVTRSTSTLNCLSFGALSRKDLFSS
jgi:hypothetical protein